MNEYQIAQQLKKPVNEVRKNLDYIKRNPYDFIQPNDKRFEDVWGKKIREQKYRRERARRDYLLEEKSSLK